MKRITLNNSFRNQHRLDAFSLTELLVVLVIIGILIFLALPNLMPAVTKAKTKEAELNLRHLYRMEKDHFLTFSRYSDDLNAISFEQNKLVSEGGTANYMIEVVEASQTTFRATATSQTDFDGDGQFNVWEIDQDMKLREVTPD